MSNASSIYKCFDDFVDILSNLMSPLHKTSKPTRSHEGNVRRDKQRKPLNATSDKPWLNDECKCLYRNYTFALKCFNHCSWSEIMIYA